MAKANPVNAPSDFPSEFPVDDLQIVINYFKGDATDLRQFAASVQAVIGFALGQLLQRPAMESAAPSARCAAEVVNLEALLAQAKSTQSNVEGFQAIDWASFAKQILQVMLPLLIKWLA